MLFLLRKLGNGRVSLIGYFRKHQQVVAPEALRTLPFIAVFVKTRTARMRHYPGISILNFAFAQQAKPPAQSRQAKIARTSLWRYLRWKVCPRCLPKPASE